MKDGEGRRRLRKAASALHVRDIAVVVAGILIAFSLDAWWQRRSDGEAQRVHLQALAEDFRANHEALETLIIAEDRIAESSLGLLEVSDKQNSVGPDSVWQLLAGVLSARRFEPSLGTYRSMQSSGMLAGIRDEALKASLANFSAQLEVRYYERFSDEIFVGLIRDYAGRLQFFAPYVLQTTDMNGLLDRAGLLLQDPHFREYLALRHVAARDVATEYRRLHEQVGIVRRQLEGQ
jgi:hypothetical protein